MPSYKHPGVYLEEIPSGAKPIEGVSTSVTAFVGAANRGPVGEPVLIGKFEDYAKTFGPVSGTDDDMGLAVMAFYLNGGKAAYVCRLASGTPTKGDVALDGTGSVSPAITVEASSEGDWAHDYYVVTKQDSGGSSFDLEVGTHDAGGNFVAEETYKGLNLDSSSDDFVELRVNNDSSLVQVTVGDGATASTLPDDTPSGGTVLDSTTGGTASAPGSQDYTDFYDDTLRKVRDVSIIVLPGQAWGDGSSGTAVINATKAHCEATASRVLILDVASGQELKHAGDVTGLSLPTSTYTTLYYPWVEMANPLYNVDINPTADKTVAVAPSAVAAALWTRTDAKRGVWKAPAGVETQLTGVSSLKYHVEDLEQDQLNPLGVNCIRKLPSYGSVIWGARTLATKASPEWRYIPVRRTAIFIERSIYDGIQWAVFEPNDEPLWGALRANIGSFMNGLFRGGAFQGKTADQAYFVRCGLGDTMTQGDIDRGQVIVVVGFAPLKPAEFVIVRIQQKVGQS